MSDPDTTPLRDLSLDDLWSLYRDWPLGRDGCAAMQSTGWSSLVFDCSADGPRVTLGPNDRELVVAREDDAWAYTARQGSEAHAHGSLTTIGDLDVHLAWVAGEAE